MSRPRASGEQLRQLAARVQAAREDERTSIARELHDELGQTLTAIKFELARIVSLLTQERISVEVIDRLQSLVGLVEIGIAVVKRIATDLRPPNLRRWIARRAGPANRKAALAPVISSPGQSLQVDAVRASGRPQRSHQGGDRGSRPSTHGSQKGHAPLPQEAQRGGKSALRIADTAER